MSCTSVKKESQGNVSLYVCLIWKRDNEGRATDRGKRGKGEREKDGGGGGLHYLLREPIRSQWITTGGASHTHTHTSPAAN